MELLVVHDGVDWFPVENGVSDAVIEVDDLLGERYLEITREFRRMSDAIEAQVHGTGD